MLKTILFNPATSATISLVAVPTVIVEGVISDSGTSSSITVTPSGGTAPYTHQWTSGTVTGGGILSSLNTPTTDTTSINYSSMGGLGTELSVDLTDTVTDFLGNSAYIIISCTLLRTD